MSGSLHRAKLKQQSVLSVVPVAEPTRTLAIIFFGPNNCRVRYCLFITPCTGRRSFNWTACVSMRCTASMMMHNHIFSRRLAKRLSMALDKQRKFIWFGKTTTTGYRTWFGITTEIPPASIRQRKRLHEAAHSSSAVGRSTASIQVSCFASGVFSCPAKRIA